MRILTVGFTQKSAKRFFELLHGAGVSRIVDVRLNNASQLAGFAKKNDLAWFARKLCGIDYTHVPSLAPTKELLSDYRNKRISWIEFESRFLDLIRNRQIESRLPKDILDNSCLLCSEDQPHHCHRRLVAEYLNEQWGDVEVKHLGLKMSEAETSSGVSNAEDMSEHPVSELVGSSRDEGNLHNVGSSSRP